jgi:hypothetical protein
MPTEKQLRRAAREEKKANKAKAGTHVPEYDLSQIEIGYAEALANKLPEDQLQSLLDRHRAGEDVQGALAKALAYLAFVGCATLNTSWPYRYLADHMMAIGVCIDRLANNDIPANDLPRYIQNEFRPGRSKGANEHKVTLPRSDRELLDDPEDVSWRKIDLDDERLDDQAREVAKLLRERRTFAEICDERGISTHALYKIIDTIKRAAA